VNNRVIGKGWVVENSCECISGRREVEVKLKLPERPRGTDQSDHISGWWLVASVASAARCFSSRVESRNTILWEYGALFTNCLGIALPYFSIQMETKLKNGLF
jgi:hypothetical protein